MKKTMLLLLWGTFFVYGFILVIILFLSSRGSWNNLSLIDYMKRFSNFIPFRTIGGYIRGISNNTMNLDIPVKNIFGNLLLFLPMGIYLPCLFKKFRKLGEFMLCMLILLLTIEVFQLLLKRGSFDIDDLIINVTGATIGFRIWNISIIQKILNALHLNN